MLITVALLSALAQSPPREPSDAWYRRHLPATIEVAQDVEATPSPVTTERRQRGTLYIARDLKRFRIKKGQTFQMIKLLGEGGCRIRFESTEYELGSCPWLEGFSDRETDIYVPVATSKGKGAKRR
jgi:hypothetical protein